MPVSKRLRYEVLRRDSHTCRYCGGAAPDVKLTVDHEWRYFCGCCWRRVRQAQERALAIATEWEEQARGE